MDAKDTNKITASEKIKEIPFLFGGEEVFGRAELLAGDNAEALSSLGYLKQIYSALCAAGYKDKILIDLGIVHALDYYTGTVFRGYMEGAGESVLAGGRYDKLISRFDADVPATGFGVNISTVVDTLIRLGKSDASRSSVEELVTFVGEGFGCALEYCSSHSGCELSPFGDEVDAVRYARRNGIGTIRCFDGVNETVTEVGGEI